MGIQPRTSNLLSTYSITEPHPQPKVLMVRMMGRGGMCVKGVLLLALFTPWTKYAKYPATHGSALPKEDFSHLKTSISYSGTLWDLPLRVHKWTSSWATTVSLWEARLCSNHLSSARHSRRVFVLSSHSGMVYCFIPNPYLISRTSLYAAPEA